MQAAFQLISADTFDYPKIREFAVSLYAPIHMYVIILATMTS